jgi:hypothetical protein
MWKRILNTWDMKKPITVAAQSKTWTVFSRSSTGMQGSNPTRVMDSVFVLFCVYVAALQRADPPSKGSYRLCMDEENEKAAKAHKGCRAVDR